MSESPSLRLPPVLEAWVAFASRHALAVVLLSALSVWGCVVYTIDNLGINTDTADMISRELDWRRTYIEYKELFPQYTDTIAVVIDGETPDLAEDARERLGQRLEESGELIQWVYTPGGGEHFERAGLLYLDTEELETLTDRLARVQPFLARLEQDPSLRGLLGLLAEAVEADADGDSFELGEVVTRIERAVRATLEGRFHRLSWWELMSGRKADVNDKRAFLIVKPRLDWSELLPAGPVIEHIRGTAASLGLTEPRGVRVRITGGAALSYEEMASVSKGMGFAGTMALIMVSIVLLLGVRSPKLVAASLLTLLIGLIWTAAFAALAVGHLNLISIAFAVLYIGLGVHYAIHFCLRYRELIDAGAEHHEALRATTGDVGSSLVLCAVTTGVGFFAFVPTRFSGVSELGLISGTGMFISLIASLTVLPALLSLMPLRARAQSRQDGSAPRASAPWVVRRRRPTLALTAAVAVAASLTLPWVRFDRDPLNLRDPGTESVATYRDLIAQSEESPWTAVVLAHPAEAEALGARLEALDRVDFVVDVRDFVPEDQDAKLQLLEDLTLVLGLDVVTAAEVPPPTLAEQLEAIASLRVALGRIDEPSETHEAASGLSVALGSVLETAQREADAGAALVAALERSTIAGLPRQLERLSRALEAQPVSLEDLPPELRERWVAPDGRYRLEVFPSENLEDPAAMQRFVDALRPVAPDVTDTPIVQTEAGNVVVSAFQQAFVSALVLVTLLLYFLLGNRKDVLLVLAPLLLAGLLTMAATVVLGIPFNFANVITLPLLLGAGVDNGIHMVQRMRNAPPAGGNLLGTSTTRAVVISALTTMASFGNLAYSAHRGTASMGQLLTIGLTMTLLCTLVVLPAMLGSGTRR